jgi:hypothetical protein
LKFIVFANGRKIFPTFFVIIWMVTLLMGALYEKKIIHVPFIVEDKS